MRKLVLLAAATFAVAGCQPKASAPTNEAGANITSVDANAMPEDANITDVPTDDGDAPAEAETNAR